jgi:hypothetical protein
MSFQLWISDRTFPLCPISDSIPQFPIGLDVFVIIVLLLTLAIGMIFRFRVIFIIVLLVMLLLFAQDQMRLQPWAYLYFLLLVPFAFKVNKTGIITYFQILIIGIYLWGGLHKFSPDFIDFTYKKILIEMFGIENEKTILSLGWLGYIVPTIELSVAFLLIIPKTRFIGIVGAVITHVFILIFLIKIDSNTILYPWNLAMILFVFLLFFRNTNKLKIWRDNNWQLRFLNSMGVILFLIMPALSFFNMWDSYLSFKLFSGKTNLFYICIEKDDVDKIDQNLKQYYWETEGLTRGEMISLNEWTLDELNVPFYPETRVFKQVAKTFCESGISDDVFIFAEFDRAFGEGDFQSFNCSDLK